MIEKLLLKLRARDAVAPEEEEALLGAMGEVEGGIQGSFPQPAASARRAPVVYSSVAMIARSVSTPSPFSDEVTMISG